MNPVDIAVVGLDCRFPKADDPAALWELLLDGADAIDEIPPSAGTRPTCTAMDLSITLPAG